jgi:hypothetical protein
VCVCVCVCVCVGVMFGCGCGCGARARVRELRYVCSSVKLVIIGSEVVYFFVTINLRTCIGLIMVSVC